MAIFSCGTTKRLPHGWYVSGSNTTVGTVRNLFERGFCLGQLTEIKAKTTIEEGRLRRTCYVLDLKRQACRR